MPLLPFLKGSMESELSFLNCFYSILATVFQPENTSEGTLFSKLTEIHLIASLPYQYKASTWQYKQFLFGKEDNKCLLNVVFSIFSFLLAPLALLLLQCPWFFDILGYSFVIRLIFIRNQS